MVKSKKIKKPNPKFVDHGNNGRNGKRPKKPKKPTVTVFLPAIIPGRGPNVEEEPPSEYEISYKDAMLAVQLENLASKGFNNDEIINRLGISRTTFYKRLKEDVYFSYCLMKHRGKAITDAENALMQNVTGFEYKEEVATPSGRVVEIYKRKLPETKAIEFFLTNRNAEQWKKKVETTIQPGEGMGAMAFVIKRRED